MKRYFISLLLLFFSCNTVDNNEMQKQSQNSSDSVLISSQKNLQNSDIIQKRSDSITKIKVSFIVKEVEKLKIEKFELLNQFKLVKENVIVRIDTVFIETKKNFWGKEKKSITIKSDTLETEFLDSSSVKEVVDTTNHL